MNQNYVRKCEEYLQNIPSQKLPPTSTAAGGGHRPGPNLSSRKLTQPGGLRQGRQSINKAATPPPPVEGSRPKPIPPPPTPVPAGGRRNPARPPTARPGQLRSKFVRPCCRTERNLAEGKAGGSGSDNVNQNDVRVMDGTGDGGEGTTGKTKTWDGILTAEAALEVTGSRTASLTQIKSKATIPSSAEPSPITSTFPNGAAPDGGNNPHRGGLTLAPNPSVTSLDLSTVTSSSVRPASSSIAAVPPQPRSSSTVLATPVVTEHVLRQQQQQQCQQPPSTATVKAEVSQQQLQGINLFRFDPLRTLQFLTLELKSKLKQLLLTMPGDIGGNDDATSAHKQLYKISKELLYAVKILTENAENQRKQSCNYGGGGTDKETNDGKISTNIASCGGPEASKECQNCLKLQNILDQRLPVEEPGSGFPRKEINYPQDLPRRQPESSKASTTDQLQLQRLEGEIKRLQTMISDKQTTTAATEGLIDDLNRKLDEATHARDEAQRKLLYATLENERLNFLLRSQCSTMANLRHDFSAIESLAGQQIDLLDRSNEYGGLNDRSRSKSNTITTITSVVGNHHRNYRSSTGSGAPLNPPTGGQVAKLRNHHHHRHYSFQNIAEKESDDGNDAANDCNWGNSTSQSQQQQQQQQQQQRQQQEPEVMQRLPRMVDGGALQEGLVTGLWQKKNRAAVELEESGTSRSGSSGSLLAVVNAASSARFGPTKRALLIDSDCEDDLKEDQQHSSSSLSSLTSSQQPQQRQGRGHERKDDQPNNNNNNNNNKGKDTGMEAISNREVPAFGDKPFIISRNEDDGEKRSDYTNNSTNNRHIQNSKTNDCVSLAPKDDEMVTNRQQLGPGGVSSSSSSSTKKDNDTLPGCCVEAKAKYPRDYGDKFERRESLLALTRPGQEERKELCQNRPIMGQIRRRSLDAEKERAEEVLVGKIISAAPGQASGTMTRTTTEEFSIDFDDITLPPSPIPFRRGDQGAGPAELEEFPSSFGDWM